MEVHLKTSAQRLVLLDSAKLTEVLDLNSMFHRNGLLITSEKRRSHDFDLDFETGEHSGKMIAVFIDRSDEKK